LTHFVGFDTLIPNYATNHAIGHYVKSGFG